MHRPPNGRVRTTVPRVLLGVLALLLSAGCGSTSHSAATPPSAGAGIAAQSAPTAPADAARPPTLPSPSSPTGSVPPPTTPTTRKASSSTPATETGTNSGAWPNASNTGYKNAPGYPGSLTRFTGTLESNHTYRFMRFTDELFVGTSDVTLHNVTFYGCLFESNNIVDTTVAVYSENVVFDYSTFAPSKAAAPPVAYTKGYQYAIDLRRDAQLTVDHSDIWGFGNAIQIGFSSRAKPFVVRNTWFHDARSDGGVDHTDASCAATVGLRTW